MEESVWEENGSFRLYREEKTSLRLTALSQGTITVSKNHSYENPFSQR